MPARRKFLWQSGLKGVIRLTVQAGLPRQIVRRILVFVLALAALFAGAAYWVSGVERSILRDIMASETAEHGVLFDRVLELAARPLEMFVESYGRRTSFTRPGDASAVAEAGDVLAAGVRTFRLDGAWVLNADDTVRLQAFGDSARVSPLPPLPPLAERGNRLRYFFERAGVPHLLVGRRLAGDGRAPGAPRGWMIAALRLDPEAINLPAMPIEGRVVILPPNPSAERSPEAFVQIDRPLPGFDGVPVATLRLYYRPDEIAIMAFGVQLKLLIMAVFVCAVLGLLAFCLWRWVIRPAGFMQASLVTGDPAHLRPLLESGGDFGRLAGLVRDLIESRAALRKSLDERARLDRDLHDGVIQILYSSGMAVTHARALLETDRENARRLLDQVQAELTATIGEVRAMLAGLAPEAAGRRSFGEIGTAVLEQARAANPRLRLAVRVDESLAARLSLAQRAQLLQFARECVSNAARHAGASELRLVFEEGREGPCLEIADDGAGFELATVRQGRGLPNLAQRAQGLAAELRIESAPGRGTRVRLILPKINHEPNDQTPRGG